MRQFLEDRLVIASHNDGKIREISALLKPFGIHCDSAKSLNLIEPDETGSTYFENALEKALACAKATGLAVLGDDSGVEVHALAGEPGLHTAPYTKQHGGREAVFAKWARLPELQKDPIAEFVCVMVIVWPDGHYESFEGRVRGKLTFPPRGEGGHGYDPVFIPDGYDQTIAEMSFAEKNSCSHRFIALNRFIDACLAKRCHS